MEAGRALEILSRLMQRQEPGANPDEVGELGGAGLLRTVGAASKEQLELAASRLPGVTERVRDLGRRLATGNEETIYALRDKLREETADLQHLTRARATLEALVWNPPTQTFLSLTLSGRRVLTDLATWRDRFGEGGFGVFSNRMARLRSGLDATVARAKEILLSISDSEANVTRPEYRAPALILARQASNYARLAHAYDVSLRHLRVNGVALEDRLLIAAMLSGDMEPVEELNRFDQARQALRERGLARDAEALVAATLVDFAPDRWDEILVRIDAFRRMDDSLDSVEASVLARSPRTPDETFARYRAALDHAVPTRSKNGDRIDAAAAILASASPAIEPLLERYDRHLAQLLGMFDAPSIAAAMLTVSPLDPAQALDTLKESVGSVTREGYFDATIEIPGLALLLVLGTGPEVTRFVVDNAVSFPGLASQTGTLGAQPLLRDNSWYLWHNRWLYRPTMQYVRAHPLHVHTVPHFG